MALIGATVSGSVVFSDAAPETPGAVAHILVEEVTRADAPATPAARMTISSVALRATGHNLPFSLSIDGIDPAKRYALRVHVDANGDGQVGAGDHISTRSYPVVTQGAPSHVQVRVHRI